MNYDQIDPSKNSGESDDLKSLDEEDTDDLTLVDEGGEDTDDLTLVDGDEEDRDGLAFVDRGEDGYKEFSVERGKEKLPGSGGTWLKGDIIDGLYLVENIVKGGMGIIYFIEHLKWNIKLVVKSPLEKFLAPEHKLRFIREAETWVNLGKHPNIATAFYVKDLQGIPRIFIEFADGGSLTSRIKKDALMEISELLDLAIQFCEGIIHAHSQGLVHRDIKPDNVLLMKDGTVKITDFGLVKTKDKSSLREEVMAVKRPPTIDLKEWKTLAGISVIGSPPYIAPEQWTEVSRADKRSDIYSFGVMLYEMICGRRPFIKAHDNPYPVKVAYHLMHKFEKPPDPKTFRRNIPVKFNNLLLKCLEKEPHNRYSSFEEIQRELIEIYRDVTKRDYERPLPGEAEIKAEDLNNRALSYLDLGKKHEARKFLEEAIRLDPNNLPASINLVILLMDEKWDTYENILLRFKSIREGNPTSYLPYYYEAIFELEWGNTSTALILITKALEIYSSGPGLWNFKGVVLYNLERYEEAGKAFEEAIKLDKLKSEYIRNYNIALYYRERYEECSEGFKELSEKFPENMEIKMDMAVSLTGIKKFPEAISLFREVLETEPSSIRGNLCMGELLSGMDIFVPTFLYIPSPEGIKEASGYLEKAQTLAPHCPRIMESLKEYAFKYSRPSSKIFPSGTGFKEKPEREFTRLTVGEILTLKGAGSGINGICFFSFGKRALSCNSDNVMELWDLQNGEIVRKFFEKNISMKCSAFDVAVSPCDNYIISGHSDGTVKMWDVMSGDCIKTFCGHKNIVKSVHFSFDGKLIVSSGADKTVKIWDVNSGECLKNFIKYCDNIFSVRFSPDSGYIAIGGQSKDIYIWSPDSGDFYKKLSGHSASILSVSFSNDGNYLLSGSEDNTLKLWDIENEKCIKTFTGHSSQIESVHFSPFIHYLVSGSGDGSIKLWNVESGECVRTIQVHNSSVTNVKFSPDGRYLLSGSRDRTLKYIKIPMEGDKVYSSVYKKEYLIVKPRTVKESFKDVELFLKLLNQAEKNLKAKKYKLAMDGFRRALDIPGYGRDEKALAGIHKAGIEAIRRSIRNIWLSRSFDLEEGIGKFNLSEDGHLIAYSGKDNNIKLISAQNGKEIRSFSGHTGRIFDVKISRARDYILSASNDNTIKFWDLKNGNCIKTIQQPVRFSTIALFSDNSQIATGGGMSTDTTVKIWDLKTGSCCATFEGHTRPVSAISVFKDGRKLISGSYDNSLKLWNLGNNKCMRDFREHTLRINDISLSPDGNLFVSASDDKAVKIWNINNSKSILTLGTHEGKVNSVDFSSDGRFIISGSSDKTVRIWNSENGSCLRVLKGHTDEIRDVKFSKDCRYIFSSGKDNSIQVWEIDWDWAFSEEELNISSDHVTISSDEKEALPLLFGDEEPVADSVKEKLPPEYKIGDTFIGEIESLIKPKEKQKAGLSPEVATSLSDKVEFVKSKVLPSLSDIFKNCLHYLRAVFSLLNSGKEKKDFEDK